MIRRLIWPSLLLAAAPALADEGPIRPEVEIPRLASPPRLEDFLDMTPPPEVAEGMARVGGFIQQDPEDGEPATQYTDVYFGYDDEAMYFVFVAFDDEPQRIRAHMNRRGQIGGDDLVEVMLDPFGDEQRGYTFIVTAAGVQWDAVWIEGSGFDDTWETVWSSRARLTDRGYVVWIGIPFKSLRFPTDPGHNWKLILLREVPRANENAFWPRVSNRIEGRLGQSATLRGLSGISPGRNAQIIPYATARSYDVLDEARAERDSDGFDADVGLDAKVVFRDRLALDVTVNPDFSQVESDLPQVAVNERFELFYPERRPFFLENSDYFSSPIDLLFTRRIADPRVGARLTGKAGPWAIGALLIDDEAPGKRSEPGEPGHDEVAWFGVARVRRELPRQSYVGAMFTGREFGDGYNRVGGVDGRYKFDDNWDLRFQAVDSQTRTLDGERLDGPAYDVSVNRGGRHFTTHVHYLDYARDFITETGFVPRADLRDLHQSTAYTFRPEGRRLLSWQPRLFAEWLEDQDGLRLDQWITPEIQWNFRRQTDLGLYASWGRQRLRPQDFPALDEPRDYDDRRWAGWFNTRFLAAFSINGRLEARQSIHFETPEGEAPAEDDELRTTLNFTLRPGRHHVIDTNYLRTELEEREGSATILVNDIARTRWNWQLTHQLSLRTILQYEKTRVDPQLTRRESRERFNADFLFVYLVNPWTALYAGYNSDYTDLTLLEHEDGNEVVRTEGDLERNAEQLFVKLSYLYRF